jgi:hypothetical protein
MRTGVDWDAGWTGFCDDGDESPDSIVAGNISHWTTDVSITTATFETRLCLWEITEKMYNRNCDMACADLKPNRKGGGNFMQQT